MAYVLALEDGAHILHLVQLRSSDGARTARTTDPPRRAAGR